MTSKILKRLSDYTKQEFDAFCCEHGLYGSDRPAFIDWTIRKHDLDLQQFVIGIGSHTSVKVYGTIGLDGKYYCVVPRSFFLYEAITAIITPDATDYEILYSQETKYFLVKVFHSSGINLFRFKTS